MKPVDPKSIRKILFITLSNIGDAVLTTPCLDLLRKFFPNSEITVMVGPRAREIFEGHPQVDRLLIYDKHVRLREKISLILKLKHEKYDLVIDLRYTAIPLLIQPRYSTPLFRKRTEEHAALRHLKQLNSIGIEGPCDFVLNESESDQKFVDEILWEEGVAKEDSYIVLGPGAANRLKRWDILKFKKLAELLREGESHYEAFHGGDSVDASSHPSGTAEFNSNKEVGLETGAPASARNRPHGHKSTELRQVKIIVVGPAEDQKEFNEIFPVKEWVNLAGKISLMQLGILLKKACLFITNDSGPMHIAAAFKTPVLAIFGPTDPKIYGPFGYMNHVVRLDLPCSPCMAGFCRIKTRDCLEALEVKQVYEVARQMLSSRDCGVSCCKK